MITVDADGPALSRGHRVRVFLITLFGLLLVWCALWGAVTPVLVVTGLAVGTVTVLVFPLPIVDFRFTVRPWPMVVLVGRFLADVVRATAQIAWIAVRPRPPAGGVTTVALTTSSDLIQTLTAIAVSLVPGSLIIEADPADRTLTIHVLDVRDGDFSVVQRQVLAQESRILRAFGATMPVAPVEATPGKGRRR